METHTHAHTDCSRNWVLIQVRAEILWEEEGFQFGFERWQGWAMSKVLWDWVNSKCGVRSKNWRSTKNETLKSTSVRNLELLWFVDIAKLRTVVRWPRRLPTVILWHVCKHIIVSRLLLPHENRYHWCWPKPWVLMTLPGLEWWRPQTAMT